MENRFQKNTRWIISNECLSTLNLLQLWSIRLKTMIFTLNWHHIQTLSTDLLDSLNKLQWFSFFYFGKQTYLKKKDQKWEKLLINISLIIGFYLFIKAIWLISLNIGQSLLQLKKLWKITCTWKMCKKLLKNIKRKFPILK